MIEFEAEYDLLRSLGLQAACFSVNENIAKL